MPRFPVETFLRLCQVDDQYTQVGKCFVACIAPDASVLQELLVMPKARAGGQYNVAGQVVSWNEHTKEMRMIIEKEMTSVKIIMDSLMLASVTQAKIYSFPRNDPKPAQWALRNVVEFGNLPGSHLKRLGVIKTKEVDDSGVSSPSYSMSSLDLEDAPYRDIDRMVNREGLKDIIKQVNEWEAGLEALDEECSGGWVYVGHTSIYPDIVKIGYTTKRFPEERLRQMSTASLEPFVCVAAIRTMTPASMEKDVHRFLRRYRLMTGRGAGNEFFGLTPDEAQLVFGIIDEDSAVLMRELHDLDPKKYELSSLRVGTHSSAAGNDLSNGSGSGCSMVNANDSGDESSQDASDAMDAEEGELQRARKRLKVERELRKSAEEQVLQLEKENEEMGQLALKYSKELTRMQSERIELVRERTKRAERSCAMLKQIISNPPDQHQRKLILEEMAKIEST